MIRPLYLYSGFILIALTIAYFCAQKRKKNIDQEVYKVEERSPSFKALNTMIKEIDSNQSSSEE